MKPVVPPLAPSEGVADQPTLLSEIRRLCDDKASDERITLPAPPTEETLRAATPVPPPNEPAGDTIPAPPPSAARRRTDTDPGNEDEPSTIPGPPRLPSIAI